MIQTIVKIDICQSKEFAAKQERFNPSIRTDALTKLLSVSQECFPSGTEPYPDGSFYKAEGDAVYYVLQKPSVGLRGAIEFMQSWYYQGLSDYPECRVLLDKGYVEIISVPGKKELTGKPFENISMFEKQLGDGKVFLTESVLESIDQTMAKFSYHSDFHPREDETIRIYTVDFLDPRTVADSSLIHALFVAHPKATEARTRIFELFVVEYLLEKGSAKNLEDIMDWARTKKYPMPVSSRFNRVFKLSDLIMRDSAGGICFRPGAEEKVASARKDFSKARDDCIGLVSTTVRHETGRDMSLSGVLIGDLIEDYLCAVFSEIRMMANYFRSTLHLFNSAPEQFARFDYILRRHLTDSHLSYFVDWRRGFILGLRKACEKNSLYIAAIFHNILATYYLNRSGQVSPYQIEKIKHRQIVLDTNVLYSLIVPSSHFNEITRYFVERLVKIGVKLQISPLTLQEYENALIFVEKNWDDKGPKSVILTRNPWLYQEYMKNPSRFLNSIGVCRSEFSLVKGLSICKDNFNALDLRLDRLGITLIRDWIELSEQEVDLLWSELRNEMTSNNWSYERYWEFISKDFPRSVKIHDMTCLENLSRKAEDEKSDALGPRVLFITVDSKLYRLRKRYPFIVTPEQFFEFILPYLFLSDVPLVDAGTFPNQLLSAQLGTLLVQRPPELAEIVAAYFRSPELANHDASEVFQNLGEDKALVLNNERFKKLVREVGEFHGQDKLELVKPTADILNGLIEETRLMEDDRRKIQEMQGEQVDREKNHSTQIVNLGQKIEKLQRTLKYWRAKARKQ